MKGKTIILAAGDFPRKGGAAWRLLANAKRVIACDSAADAYRRRFRKYPDVIIGDLDSLSSRPCNQYLRRLAARALASQNEKRPSIVPPSTFRLQLVSDQDTNDLEKALLYCAERGWKNPLIVGATGKREDHTLGNIFRALAYGAEVVTDYGRFVPICGKRTLRLKKGTPVSIFAPDPSTRMTSKGLEWPLGTVAFKNLYCATLNRASASVVCLFATHPVAVYVAHG